MLVLPQHNHRSWVFPMICLPLMSRLQGFVVVGETPCAWMQSLLGHRFAARQAERTFFVTNLSNTDMDSIVEDKDV